jgi:hypothetical protein
MFPLQNEPYTGTRRHPIRRPGILPSIASEKSGNAAPRREGPEFRFLSSPLEHSRKQAPGFRRKCDQGRIGSTFPTDLPERARQSSGSTLTMLAPWLRPTTISVVNERHTGYWPYVAFAVGDLCAGHLALLSLTSRLPGVARQHIDRLRDVEFAPTTRIKIVHYFRDSMRGLLVEQPGAELCAQRPNRTGSLAGQARMHATPRRVVRILTDWNYDLFLSSMRYKGGVG